MRALRIGSLVVGMACAFAACRSSTPREAKHEVLRGGTSVDVFPTGDRLRLHIGMELVSAVPAKLDLHLAGADLDLARVIASEGDATSVTRFDREHVELAFDPIWRDTAAARPRFFLQLIDRPLRRYGWGHVTGVVPWIDDLGVGKGAGAWLETDVHLVSGLRAYSTGGQDLRCGAAPYTSCRDFGYGPRELIVAMEPFDDRRERVALAVVLLACAALLGLVTVRAFRRLLARRSTFEAGEVIGYRGIAAGAPRLPPKVVRTFQRRVAFGVGLATASLALFVFLLEGRSPIPMPWATSLAAAFVTSITALLVTSSTARRLRPAGIGLCITAFVWHGGTWFAAALVPLAFAGLLELASPGSAASPRDDDS